MPSSRCRRLIRSFEIDYVLGSCFLLVFFTLPFTPETVDSVAIPAPESV